MTPIRPGRPTNHRTDGRILPELDRRYVPGPDRLAPAPARAPGRRLAPGTSRPVRGRVVPPERWARSRSSGCGSSRAPGGAGRRFGGAGRRRVRAGPPGRRGSRSLVSRGFRWPGSRDRGGPGHSRVAHGRPGARNRPGPGLVVLLPPFGLVLLAAVIESRRVLVGPARLVAGITGAHVRPANRRRRLVPAPAWSLRSGVPGPVSWSGVVIRGLRWVAGLGAVVVSSDGSGSIGPRGHGR